MNHQPRDLKPFLRHQRVERYPAPIGWWPILVVTAVVALIVWAGAGACSP